MELHGQPINPKSLVMTNKAQTVNVLRVDGDVAIVEYPNGRRGTVPTADLEVLIP